jgi:hypothetical protein
MWNIFHTRKPYTVFVGKSLEKGSCGTPKVVGLEVGMKTDLRIGILGNDPGLWLYYLWY